MVESRDYDALADDINLEDITSCEHNANILRKIRDGDQKQLCIICEEEEDEEDVPDGFFVNEGDHLGFLGYFIGKSEVLEDLHIWSLPGERNNINFLEGMSRNRSIQSLKMHSEVGGVDDWNRLGSFFENNRNLSQVGVGGYLGHLNAQNLASALGRMNHNSLIDLSLECTEIGDEGLAEISTTLRLHPQLKNLQLFNNDVGRSGCIALGNTLSRWPASNKLESLSLDSNVIDDEGLQALVSGMMNCCSLKELCLSRNQSITTDGLRSLFPLLQSEAHSLERLSLYGIGFGDDGAMVFAEMLRSNKSLKGLWFSRERSGMTSIGWSAFSRLLCDASTISSTSLSNHTLTRIGYLHNIPEDVERLLTTNRIQNRQGAAIFKILRSHPDLDMEAFFEWKMQLLPAITSWFERVDNRIGMGSERSCQSRKLSALYKFVRAMPDLTIIGYWEGRMIHIEAERHRIADERRRLDDEERGLEYEEKITLERLGDQPMDEAEVNINKRMKLE